MKVFAVFAVFFALASSQPPRCGMCSIGTSLSCASALVNKQVDCYSYLYNNFAGHILSAKPVLLKGASRG